MIEESTGPTSWNWPPGPETMLISDPATEDAPTVLNIHDTSWRVPVSGSHCNHPFEPGARGLLQRRLAFATQVDVAPATFDKFVRTTRRNWVTYERLLMRGPQAVAQLWDVLVDDVDVAKAGKTILKYACASYAGPWSPLNLTLVTSLDTRAKSSLAAQQNSIRERSKVISATQERAIVHLLDESNRSDLSEADCEAVVGLAAYYEHGMRPTQALNLRVHHVTVHNGSAGAVLSFHKAKRKHGRQATDPAPDEIPRVIRPEWSTPVRLLRSYAIEAGRKRLFRTTTNGRLLSSIRAYGAKFGINLDFTAGWLRHSFAQRMADRGSCNDQIRRGLGQSGHSSPRPYVEASLATSNTVSDAISSAKVYVDIVALADGAISPEQLMNVPEDEQIGAVINGRPIAGLGRCGRGQSMCPSDPVVSCYGCHKYIPSTELSIHHEAVAAMKSQVTEVTELGTGASEEMIRQLKTALDTAQVIVLHLEKRAKSQ